MTLNDYQRAAHETAIYPGYDADTLEWLDYLIPALQGEVGELSSLVAKWRRDGGDFPWYKAQTKAGDCLWVISEIAKKLRAPLHNIAFNNLAKLKSRHARGVLTGSGDER